MSFMSFVFIDRSQTISHPFISVTIIKFTCYLWLEFGW